MQPTNQPTKHPFNLVIFKFGLNPILFVIFTLGWAAVQEAKEEGCAVVSGVEMFIGQAEEQYRLFTQREPPAGLMRKAVMMGLAREQLGVK